MLRQIIQLTPASLLLAGVFLFVSVGNQPNCFAGFLIALQVSQTEQDTEVEIAEARQVLEAARAEFEIQKRLFASGSTSERKLRRAEFDFDHATVQLDSLQRPEREEINELLGAKLVANYRSTEFELLKKLYRKGTASKLDFDRAKSAARIAGLRVEVLESRNDEDQQNILQFKIATIQFARASDELELANRLFQKGSVSRETLLKFEQQYELAETTLAQRKEAVGARVRVTVESDK